MENDDIVVLYSSDIGVYAYKVKNNTLEEVLVTEAVIKRGKELKRLKYQ